MESSEVCPGIDSALLELGRLCSEENYRDRLKELPEKTRVQYKEIHLNYITSKSHDRYLMPSQAWNRPGNIAEVGGISGLSDSIRNNYQATDGENTENSYAIRGSRVVKILDPKDGLSLENSNSPCRSAALYDNEGLSVLKMDSDYVTGVSIAVAGSSSLVFGQSNVHTLPVNNLSTPKHGPSAPLVRYHHMRPYEIPWRRDGRPRTKSETAEKEAAMKLMDRIGVSLNYPVINRFSKPSTEKFRRRLSKSRSLENVRLAEDDISQVPLHEMDSMSNRIQHLHVDD